MFEGVFLTWPRSLWHANCGVTNTYSWKTHRNSVTNNPSKVNRIPQWLSIPGLVLFIIGGVSFALIWFYSSTSCLQSRCPPVGLDIFLEFAFVIGVAGFLTLLNKILEIWLKLGHVRIIILALITIGILAFVGYLLENLVGDMLWAPTLRTSPVPDSLIHPEVQTHLLW